ELGTPRNGLKEDEVEARHERFGRNEVAHEKPPTWYAELARAFANPFNFLLTTLAVISGVTGDDEAMIVIAVMVAFSTGLRFVQEFRSNKSAQALRALVRTSTAVERENRHRRIAAIYERRGRLGEAMTEWLTALRLSGKQEVVASVEHAYRSSGYAAAKRAYLRGDLHEALRRAQNGYPRPRPLDVAADYALLR